MCCNKLWCNEAGQDKTMSLSGFCKILQGKQVTACGNLTPANLVYTVKLL